MQNKPNGGVIGLVVAKIVCCLGLLLLFTGVLTLSGIGAWLFDGGLVWLAAALALVAAGLYYLRQRKSRNVLSKAPGGQIRAERPR